MWFGKVPVIRFGWNFQKMHKKIVIFHFQSPRLPWMRSWLVEPKLNAKWKGTFQILTNIKEIFLGDFGEKSYEQVSLVAKLSPKLTISYVETYSHLMITKMVQFCQISYPGILCTLLNVQNGVKSQGHSVSTKPSCSQLWGMYILYSSKLCVVTRWSPG